MFSTEPSLLKFPQGVFDIERIRKIAAHRAMGLTKPVDQPIPHPMEDPLGPSQLEGLTDWLYKAENWLGQRFRMGQRLPPYGAPRTQQPIVVQRLPQGKSLDYDTVNRWTAWARKYGYILSAKGQTVYATPTRGTQVVLPAPSNPIQITGPRVAQGQYTVPSRTQPSASYAFLEDIKRTRLGTIALWAGIILAASALIKKV